MRTRTGATRALPGRGAALKPSRPFSEPAPPRHDSAMADMDAQIEQARLYGHRLPDAAPGHSPAVVQCFWPLDSLARLIGIGGEDEPETTVTPLKASYVAKQGETHKPIKLKDKDEVYSKTLIGGSEPEKAKEKEKEETPPVETAPVETPVVTPPQEERGVFPRVDMGAHGQRPGSYTHPEPLGPSFGPPGSIPNPFKPKVNWMDFSVGGVDREKQAKTLIKSGEADKAQGRSYKASLLRGTYSREKVGGGGKDRMYKVSSGESLSGQLLHGKGKLERDLIPGLVKGHIKGETALGGVEGGYDGGAKVDAEKDMSAGVGLRANLGAYAAKGSIGGGLDFRIPYTNVNLSLGAKGEAAYGLGVGGEASFKASRKKGVRAALGAKLVSGLGFGGGLSFGIGKADPEKGWLGGDMKSDDDYLNALPAKGTANRWKDVPDDVKARLQARLRAEELQQKRNKRKNKKKRK